MPASRNAALAFMLAFVLPAAGPVASAETIAPLDHKVISARVAGRALRIDGTRNDAAGAVSPAPPFQLVVPTDRDGTWGARLAKSPKNTLARVIFTMPDGAFVENIGFFSATLPFSGTEARLERFATLLNFNVVPILLKQFPDGQKSGIRKTRVGPYEAVEIFGGYTHPDYGPMQWRLVGIPHPDRRDSIYTLSQIALRSMPLPSVDDFGHSLWGMTLESMRYIK